MDFNTINQIFTYEQIIKKSKFVGYFVPILSQDDATNFLLNLKQQHKKATHFCYAYVLNGGMLEKCSDDKEPSSTAGKPMLSILKHNNYSNCMFVVVRYYGGTKLGVGNLMRAYTSTCSELVKLCKSNGE